MIKDLMNKQVVVVTLRERSIGKLVEISDKWIKLVNIAKKDIMRFTIIKIEAIMVISEF